MSDNSSNIENVFVFVSDALRWDFLPDAVRERGKCVKTVSSSTLSPTSFASMFSGLHPSNHGVNTFADAIRYDHTIYALNGFDTPIVGADDGEYLSLVHDGVTPSQENRLSECTPPFIYVERDMSTHAPYQTDANHDNWSDEDARAYLDRESANLPRLAERYARSAEVSAERFTQRVSYLQDNDLLESTLIVFTADHGELLGEYTEFSHTYPLVPELVYVPTVMLHPNNLPVQTRLFSHVDLVPTITDVLGVDVEYETDGQSAYEGPGRKRAICQVNLPQAQTARGPITSRSLDGRLQTPAFEVNSVWDGDGGWVFNKSAITARLSYLAKSLLPSRRKRAAVRQQPRELVRLAGAVTKRSVCYGTPRFSETEAREEIDSIDRRNAVSSQRSELGDERQAQLENLGYI